jgi:hypothetical protein
MQQTNWSYTINTGIYGSFFQDSSFKVSYLRVTCKALGLFLKIKIMQNPIEEGAQDRVRVFVNFFRSQRIDSQPGGPVSSTELDFLNTQWGLGTEYRNTVIVPARQAT